MNIIKKKPELLAPAGNLKKMIIAFEYGADAVYLGGQEFSMRAASDNFSREDLRFAVDYAHRRNKKIYVAVNIVPRNDEIEKIADFVKYLGEIKVDAVIVTDIGIMSIVRENAPELDIHVSTQANITNYKACLEYYKLGAKRVVLARELSLSEIAFIKSKIPSDMEIECFIHGAMCISYSGRCLMSNYLTGRDSNHGSCAHPCRWKYSLMEETRPGEYFPVYEGEEGTYIFNSKDMCMIEHIDDLYKAGIDSFKIEGRVKSAFYVAGVTAIYRKEIDRFLLDPENYSVDENSLKELAKISHRSYFTGFFYPEDKTLKQRYDSSNYIRDYIIIGFIEEYDENMKNYKCRVKNKFLLNTEAEALTPSGDVFEFKINSIINDRNENLDAAKSPEAIVYINLPKKIKEHSIIRCKRD